MDFGSDELPEELGGRDDLLGTDLHLNLKAEQLSLFPSEQEQIRKLDASIVQRHIGTERSDRPVLHLSDDMCFSADLDMRAANYGLQPFIFRIPHPLMPGRS